MEILKLILTQNDYQTVTRVTIEDRFGNDFQTAGGMLHFQYIVYFTHSVNCGVLKSVGHLACNIPALFPKVYVFENVEIDIQHCGPRVTFLG